MLMNLLRDLWCAGWCSTKATRAGIQDDVILSEHLTVRPSGADLHGVPRIRMEPQGLPPAIHELSILHSSVLLRENAAFLARKLCACECGGDVSIVPDGLTSCGSGIGFEEICDDLKILLRTMLF